jgi:hypothetical protein
MVLTMVYNTQNYWVFGLFPSFSLEYQTMEKVQKPSNSESHTDLVFLTPCLYSPLITLAYLMTYAHSSLILHLSLGSLTHIVSRGEVVSLMSKPLPGGTGLVPILKP